MTDLSPCGEMVRRGDPVRFRTALFAAPEAREGLFALYAFNLEIAKIAPMVSEPMIGEIRLQWWRDSLEMIFGDEAIRRHEVVEPLSSVIRSAELPRAPFETLIDARAHDLDPGFPPDEEALCAYLRDTAGSLTLLAMRALGGDGDKVALDAGEGIGIARYLAAIPALAAQGSKPLSGAMDWRTLRGGGGDEAFDATMRRLAERGRTLIAHARSNRGAVAKSASPAFLEVPIADRALSAILAGGTGFADLGADRTSPFRANLSNLWRGTTGRW